MSNQGSGRISRIVMCREVRRDEVPYAWLWKFRATPTWILTMILWPTLKADHPWRQRNPFSLMEWYGTQTAECRELDMMLYLAGMMALTMVVKLVTR